MPGRRNVSTGRISAAVFINLLTVTPAALVFAPAASAQSAAPIVMKFSTATLNDTQHEWMRRFAAAVEKDSGGRIKGELYPASQLGTISRQIEGIDDRLHADTVRYRRLDRPRSGRPLF